MSKREWDFEGRCVKCHKALDMKLNCFSSHSFRLDVVPCSEHPNDSVILWPQRDDIIRVPATGE